MNKSPLEEEIQLLINRTYKTIKMAEVAIEELEEIKKKSMSYNFYTDKKIINSEKILLYICQKMDAEPSKIKARTRKREISFIRQLYFYFVRRIDPSISLDKVGYVVDRNHATVLHGVSAINNLMYSDKKILAIVNDIESEIPLIKELLI